MQNQQRFHGYQNRQTIRITVERGVCVKLLILNVSSLSFTLTFVPDIGIERKTSCSGFIGLPTKLNGHSARGKGILTNNDDLANHGV